MRLSLHESQCIQIDSVHFRHFPSQDGNAPQRGDRWACEPGSVPRAVTRTAVTTIHLDRALPHGSSSLPGRSGEQPSNAPCMALLRTGFTEPRRSPGALVVSYTTFSP